jgi:hypothetical protein
MNKPTITIDLKKHLESFLLHEFEKDKAGRILLHRRSSIGKIINLMWDASDRPVPPPKRENPVTFVLSLSKADAYVKTHRFLYVPTWMEEYVQTFLEEEFRRRVRDFFSIGYEKGFKQKNIIEGFLQAYDIKNNAINFDMIKKMDYRGRKNIKKYIKMEIQNSDNQ